MNELFLEIVNMSISAGWVVLFLLLLRPLLMKAPGRIRMALWGVAALRLLVPFSLESVLSLLPSGQTVSPDVMLSPNPAITSGIPAINEAVNDVLSQNFTPAPGASINPLQIAVFVLAIVWLVGAAVMLGYFLVSYLRLRRQIQGAVPHSEGVWFSEHIATPFLLGLRRPKIYLPYFMDDDAIPAVLAHERAHIRRKDNWWKPLGFLLLSIHWFNPLIWVAYILMCRDMEMACDEAVIRDMDSNARADYAQALLNCSAGRSYANICPVAFGEANLKMRIKNILNYTKPGILVLAVSAVICVVAVVCFLTNPIGRPGELKEGTLTEHQKTNIEHAHFAYVHGLRWSKDGDVYYGNYEGYDFFLISRKFADGKDNVRIGGEVFQSNHFYFDIYGYQNGEFQRLSYLYAKHLVSQETVTTLAQINAGVKECPVLSESLKAEVEENWLAPYLEMQEDYHLYWNNCRYYGTIEGYDVLNCVGELTVVSSISIGDHIFTNGVYFELYAYKDGRMYLLKELYEDGKISEQSIAALWEKHKEWFPVFYD